MKIDERISNDGSIEVYANYSRYTVVLLNFIEEFYMDGLAKLERLFKKGYILDGPLIHLSDYTSESIERVVSFFNIELDQKTLLDLSNSDKTLLILRHQSSSDRIEILTSDERAICRAEKQLVYQDETVGTYICVFCTAFGCEVPCRQIIYLNNFANNLNDFLGWQFKLGDTEGTFELARRLDSTEEGAIQKALDELQCILDILSVFRKTAFLIWGYSVSPIRRTGRVISSGPEETFFPPVTHDEIDRIKAALSTTEAKDAFRGLRESYVENTRASRLSRLWAVTEGLFCSKPERMLTDEEVNLLLKAAEDIKSLNSDKKRLEKLKETFQDPNRLPLKNRNERMAESIAFILDVSKEEAYSKIKEASKMRGMHSHQLLNNWEGIEASEMFLREVLITFLKKHNI